MAAITFDEWFGTNYHHLRTKAIPCNLFGEIYNTALLDLFHDAYLVARSMACDASENEYKIIFKSAWKAQQKRHLDTQAKKVRPKDVFWTLLSEESEESTKDFSALCSIVLDFARKNFSKSEYEIFVLYYKNGLTSYEIADYCGVTQGTAFYRLRCMKQFLCAAFVDEFNLL